jgi:hypothetical protein
MNSFFGNSDSLDYMVLRPLDHIRGNWELIWNPESEVYEEGPDSFAGLLNGVIAELAAIESPSRYHDSEDRLAEYVKKNSIGESVRRERDGWGQITMSYCSREALAMLIRANCYWQRPGEFRPHEVVDNFTSTTSKSHISGCLQPSIYRSVAAR